MYRRHWCKLQKVFHMSSLSVVMQGHLAWHDYWIFLKITWCMLVLKGPWCYTRQKSGDTVHWSDVNIKDKTRIAYIIQQSIQDMRQCEHSVTFTVYGLVVRWAEHGTKLNMMWNVTIMWPCICIFMKMPSPALLIWLIAGRN